MNEFILNSNSPSKRARLTREELLAGKCFPDQDQKFQNDPRLRSPDDTLSQRAPRWPAQEITPAPLEEIDPLQTRYQNEIKAWREYEARVQEWKRSVTAILDKYKSAATENENLSKELEKARELIRKQSEELMWFRQHMAPNSEMP